MKLRIKGSTIRLRLSQTEVKEIAAGQQIQETVYFGQENILKYTLIPDTVEELTATFENDTIKIYAPALRIKQWCENEDDVGFDRSIRHAEGTSLYILVEKDYKCLDIRDEDESDLFENPNAGKQC